MATPRWIPKATARDEANLGRAAIVPPERTPGSSLEVIVLHTTTEGTLQALKTAAGLAQGLAARIRLLVPQVVPYPRPLTSPPISRDFTARRFRTLVSGAAIETHIDVRLCRDQWEMLESALRPKSLVVLGARRRWWPTAESRLVERLRHLGHQVIFSSLA